ncbi:MAG TPA: O-methyltransferase [Actinomycetota bacterium]|nr:O-methyltransferase [Actinomycetota bacterium]
MVQELWTAIDDYITALLVPPDAPLQVALEASAKAGLPPHQVSPSQGKLLQLLARLRGAQNILEIGTLGGYSTIWLAGGLSERGRVVTLESDAGHAEVARTNIARAGLAEVVEVRVGPALDTLSRLVQEGAGPFDLIFIDADKANNDRYFHWALELSETGTLIIADNVVRSGAIVDDASTDPSVMGARRFMEALAAEPRVSATALQTVGAKGHDGFVVALVL